jgi:hypothetical protein
MPPLRDFDACFEREQGCTEGEWLSWLPGAVRGHALSLQSPGRAVIDIDGGTLAITWQTLPPRRIALISMPRMAIGYRFDGVDAAARSRFMQYFDLYMQRGGG